MHFLNNKVHYFKAIFTPPKYAGFEGLNALFFKVRSALFSQNQGRQKIPLALAKANSTKAIEGIIIGDQFHLQYINSFSRSIDNPYSTNRNSANLKLRRYFYFLFLFFSLFLGFILPLAFTFILTHQFQPSLFQFSPLHLIHSGIFQL